MPIHWRTCCFAACLFANAAHTVAADYPIRQLTERLISPISPGKLSKFTISPDGNNVAYIATADDKAFNPTGKLPGDYGPSVVILNGKKGRTYESIEHHRQPIFSSDSKRIAYIARRDSKPFIVVDGREFEHFGEGKIRDG